jgi:hypothetical protein
MKTTGVAVVAFARSTCSSSCSVIGLGEAVVLMSSSSIGSGGRLDDRRRGAVNTDWFRVVVEPGSRGHAPHRTDLRYRE